MTDDALIARRTFKGRSGTFRVLELAAYFLVAAVALPLTRPAPFSVSFAIAGCSWAVFATVILALGRQRVTVDRRGVQFRTVRRTRAITWDHVGTVQYAGTVQLMTPTSMVVLRDRSDRVIGRVGGREFGDDIVRFLVGEADRRGIRVVRDGHVVPTAAPPQWVEVLPWSERHPGTAVLIGVLGTLLALGLFGVVFWAFLA